MHKNLNSMLRKAINSTTEPNYRTNNVTLAYWKQRLLVTNMKGVAMSILAQHPTCRNPSCIHRIETHRYNLLPIGSNTSYTSNSCLHYPNDILQPPSNIQQPPSNTFTSDSIPIPTDNLPPTQPTSNPPSNIQQPPSNTSTNNPIPITTDNLSLTQPTSNPSNSTTYSGCLSYPLPNIPFCNSFYHTNLYPTDPPMVSSLPTSPNIAVYPTNGSTSLWSQPTLFENIWNYEPSTTYSILLLQLP